MNYRLGVYCLLTVSLLINFLQARYIRGLQHSYYEQRTAAVLTPGTTVEDLSVLDTSGHPVRLSFKGDKGTIIYVFRPSCVWCQRNVPLLGVFAPQVSSSYRVVGLSLSSDGLTDFSWQVPFPVYSGLSDSAISKLHLGVTPETIVISSAGAVKRSWEGAYVGKTREALEDFFSISLKTGS